MALLHFSRRWVLASLRCSQENVIFGSVILSQYLHKTSDIKHENVSQNKDYRQQGGEHQYLKFKYGCYKNLAGLVGIGGAVALFFLSLLDADCSSSLQEYDEPIQKYGLKKEGLPVYTMHDVNQHNSLEKRVWVAFRHGVYDITDFIASHPGGDKILIGAGGSVEPFWALYAIHKNEHVLKLLETFRIGNLEESEVGAYVEDMTDPYANEPRRHVALKTNTMQPYNAETPLSILAARFITPNETFYIRNHLSVPNVDPASYELEITGIDVNDKTFGLEDIKKFPKYTITSTIQCGGNRRSDMMKTKPVKGISWGPAAIGNATWSGARLCDVLHSVGFDGKNTRALHVQFEGLDTDPMNEPYGTSIPIEKAMDPKGDVLLAYEMNGKPLSRDHGFPVRVVVPGVVGARNVKWLGRIVVSEEESDSHWQQRDYKCFAPNVNWDTVDFSKSPAIQDLPVNSAICEPAEGETVSVVDGKVTVKGYAYSGGGRKIIRVDVSSDGGNTWKEVDHLDSGNDKHPRAWAWSLWEASVPVAAGVKNVEIVVKAVDSQHNTQPESFRNIWNLRGLLSNAYHRVRVELRTS